MGLLQAGAAGIQRIVRYLATCYALDYRSLALFRMLSALVIMADLAQRLGFAKSLYSDTGVYPRIHAIPFIADARWSINFLNGSPAFAFVVILTGLVAAGLMLVGWRTRPATVVLWVVVVSLHSRNPLVTYGGDDLMRMVLFWSMFLSLGRVWSFDSRNAPAPRTATVSTIATFGLLLQNVFLYLFTALLKDGVAWRELHDAVYYALGMRDLTTWLGDWLFHNGPSQLFTAITVGTLWIEFAVPMMLIAPVRVPMLRLVAVALVVGLHVGIASTMSVGLFPAISIACISALLPSSFWTYARRTRFAKWLAGSRWFSYPAPTTSAMAEPRHSQQASTVATRNTRTHSDVLPRIAVNAICLLGIVLGLMWNLTTVSSFGIPQPAARVAAAGNVFQSWGMFAPTPRGTTVWFIVEGELESGERIDLLGPIISDDFDVRHPVIWDQRDEVWLRNEPWRKYFERMTSETDQPRYLAGYGCRMWNSHDRGDQRLNRVTITVASSTTLPGGQHGEPVYRQLGTWECS